jgi:hypothetical protein
MRPAAKKTQHEAVQGPQAFHGPIYRNRSVTAMSWALTIPTCHQKGQMTISAPWPRSQPLGTPGRPRRQALRRRKVVAGLLVQDPSNSGLRAQKHGGHVRPGQHEARKATAR